MASAIDLEDLKPWTARSGPARAQSGRRRCRSSLDTGEPPIVGTLAVIHAIEERYAPSSVAGLIPAQPALRHEMWRLLDWVLVKLNDEVTRYILEEKIVKRDQRGMTPSPACCASPRRTSSSTCTISTGCSRRAQWIAGESMTLADFALAAHLSSLDYMGDVLWESSVETRDWYARIKSRPAFRTLLNDRVAGLPAASGYADLDF